MEGACASNWKTFSDLDMGKQRGQKWPCLFVSQHIVVQAFCQKAVLPAILLEKSKT